MTAIAVVNSTGSVGEPGNGYVVIGHFLDHRLVSQEWATQPRAA
jgi:hypothetical protein